MAYPSPIAIKIAMENPAVSYIARDLIGGKILKKGVATMQYTGGFSTVFPFFNLANEKIAIRCWHKDIGDPKLRTEAISSFIRSLRCNYFVEHRYVEDAIFIDDQTYPIVVMDWVEYPNLREYLQKNRHNSALVLQLAEKFLEMVKFFHLNNIAHGDLSHANIKVKPDGSLVIIDYDSMYVSGLENLPDVIKGQHGYQHPARNSNKLIHQKLDYFSELTIYLSLLVYAKYPSLWIDDAEWLIFSKEDLETPGSSQTIKHLLGCGDKTVVYLTSRILDFLQCNDISLLKPLDEVLYKDIDEIVDSISNKF